MRSGTETIAKASQSARIDKGERSAKQGDGKGKIGKGKGKVYGVDPRYVWDIVLGYAWDMFEIC